LQNQDQNRLYKLITKLIPNSVIATKNKARTWKYGYNEKYKIVVISKDGTIGDIYNINSLIVALPATPKLKSDEKKENQYWKPALIKKELKKFNLYFIGIKPLLSLKQSG